MDGVGRSTVPRFYQNRTAGEATVRLPHQPADAYNPEERKKQKGGVRNAPCIFRQQLSFSYRVAVMLSYSLDPIQPMLL